MGEIVDVLAQEIFVRMAARETLEPGEPDVEKRAAALARLCYELAEGFVLHARTRGGLPGTAGDESKAH